MGETRGPSLHLGVLEVFVGLDHVHGDGAVHARLAEPAVRRDLVVRGDASADEAGGVLVVGEEAAHCRHVALAESLGQRALVDDHDVVLEVGEAELVL